MISQQEHEAWDVLLACQGRLRLTPSGHVIGIDMLVAFNLAAARGFDLALLSELLPAAKVGLVEALSTDQQAVLGLHRARSLLVRQRTQLANAIRACWMSSGSSCRRASDA